MAAERRRADTKVIPFARDAVQEADPLAKLRLWTMTPKQLETVREMQRAYDAFWRRRGPQQERARKPRNVARNRRIHDLHEEGKSAAVIAKAEGLSASQVRRVLEKKRP